MTTIYFDPNLTEYHNPDFGSLENGQRINIDMTIYQNKGCRISYPYIDNKYLKILKDMHIVNPIYLYISITSFDKNFLQRIFNIKPKSRTIRNCHGCTVETNENICPICGSMNSDNKFFRYAHCIDKNILESDTTYITHTSYLAVKNSVSLVCQMIDDVIKGLTKHGFSFVRPPGHHASHNKSEGFCLINNIAICANYALSLGLQKIFIFDFDAHHGNGTQEIFYHRNDVYYCSMHTIESYPQTGPESEIGIDNGKFHNLNIIVPKGINDQNYLKIFRSKVLPTVMEYKPDIILVSAGFDGLHSDPMAIMNLTPECYGQITKDLVSCGVSVLMILEGGYNIPELQKCYEKCIDELVKE
jgi:acetoin utilization deacetylase AcuC-like enzyme